MSPGARGDASLKSTSVSRIPRPVSYTHAVVIEIRFPLRGERERDKFDNGVVVTPGEGDYAD